MPNGRSIAKFVEVIVYICLYINYFNRKLRFLIINMPNDRSIAKFVEVINYFYLNINYKSFFNLL